MAFPLTHFPFLQAVRAHLKTLSPANLILTPIKQHLGCCVIAPLIVKLLGGVALAKTITDNSIAEFIFLLILLPPVVYGILKLEDAWRQRHEKSHKSHGEHCDSHCHPAQNNFHKRFLINLAVACLLALVLHLVFHNHPAPMPLK
jgi:hypothetical protein